MGHLFAPLKLRGFTFRNRIGMSPMCTFCCEDGIPTAWHLVHLGSRAMGGAGVVIAEATAVAPEGRISPADAGIWNDAQMLAWRPIAGFIREQGAAAVLQLAHAGRKASTRPPAAGRGVLSGAEGGWTPVAPSAISFHEGAPAPRMLEEGEISGLVERWADAARRALEAGFDGVEIHMAHGYLMHQFLSPLSNRRTDAHGGSFENRTRAPLAVAAAVRAVWPEDRPLFVRISCTDWAEGGWDIDEAVRFAAALKGCGVDLVDCSSGGTVPTQRPPADVGAQIPFARRIREETGVATAAVGGIARAEDADRIIRDRTADLALVGREFLRDPYWAIHAAVTLGQEPPWPGAYKGVVG